jgi:fatty acid desaturase
MKLRFRADRRTLVWAFVLFPWAALLPLVEPRLAGWTLPLSLYAGFCAGVLAHNQNHCPIFAGRRANAFYAAWLSVFYGYPTFVWIPTHNRNHHTFLNGPGDASITWRYSRRNTWLAASTFFFVSAYWQKAHADAFIRQARATRPRLYRRILLEWIAVVAAQASMLALAVALHGARTGLLAYVSGPGAMAAMGLWGMMFINYIQHVDCDPRSEHDHSRNFVGKLGNWLVFNAGYHTAHHEHPGAHWSALPALHAGIADRIHPALLQPSILGFCLKTYVLGALCERHRTQQIGRAAYE